MTCRKTSSRHDSCMISQEKIHPKCAQRPPESLVPQTSNGYHPPPTCHLVAETCREDPECRPRLESFEQACAIDSVTKKCAGRMSTCRMSLLGILGTVLRTSCACQGTETHQMYDCLGWQRLLWLNPCVGKWFPSILYLVTRLNCVFCFSSFPLSLVPIQWSRKRTFT